VVQPSRSGELPQRALGDGGRSGVASVVAPGLIVEEPKDAQEDGELAVPEFQLLEVGYLDEGAALAAGRSFVRHVRISDK